MMIVNPEQVKSEIEQLIDQYQVGEITILSNFHGADHRREGIELLAQKFGFV